MHFTSNIVVRKWTPIRKDRAAWEAQKEEAESAEVQNGMNKIIYVTAKAHRGKFKVKRRAKEVR